MRFHVVALPHTQVNREFSSCAFTQKVIRFCQMMKGRGHEVFLYAGTRNEAPVDVLFHCISEPERQAMVGNKHYTQPEWGGVAWDKFNENAILAMRQVVQPHDFICLIGGHAQKKIAEAFPHNLNVEFGIGYAGTFAKYRVFESYAWMHTVYGAQAGSPERANGVWFDAVIPNQFDDTIFHKPPADAPRDYHLYAGRLIDRKGYRIAQSVCEMLGERLILAGSGNQSGYGEFVGDQRPEQLADLMRGAKALWAPTEYVEPFGTVTVEAMACGTPVICTDWGAFTETVAQGVDGFRCRMQREFLAAARQIGVLDSDAIAARAHSRFSMAAVAPMYESYFERLSSLWQEGWYSK